MALIGHQLHAFLPNPQTRRVQRVNHAERVCFEIVAGNLSLPVLAAIKPLAYQKR